MVAPKNDTLAFRPRARCPHDILIVVPERESASLRQALDILERYGQSARHSVIPCIAGDLESVALRSAPACDYRAIHVEARNTTHELYATMRTTRDAQVLPLERLRLKLVCYVRVPGLSMRTHAIIYDAPPAQARAKCDAWLTEGIPGVLARRMDAEERFANEIVERDDGRRVLAAIGLQTIDGRFVLDRGPLEGPYRCWRWAGAAIVAPCEGPLRHAR